MNEYEDSNVNDVNQIETVAEQEPATETITEAQVASDAPVDIVQEVPSIPEVPVSPPQDAQFAPFVPISPVHEAEASEVQESPVQEVYVSPIAAPGEIPVQDQMYVPPAPVFVQVQPSNPDTQPYTQQVYTPPQPQYGYPGVNVNPGPGYAGQGYNQAPYNGPVYPQPGMQPGYTGAAFTPPPPLPPKAPPYKSKKKREKKQRKPMNLSTAALVSIIIICCVVSGIGGGLVGANINGGNETITYSDGESNVINIEASSDITVTEAVAKKVLASVVGITSTGTIMTQDFFYGEHESVVTGVGTGMVLDTKGYILTNSHVVMDGTVESINVLLSTGEEVDGKVIWSDASLDLAVVKIEAEGLSPVELGNSDEVAIGSYVAAIGNPLGLSFNGSITQGVVSGLDRTITVSDESGSNISVMEDLIQVDAAINSGNSGGPLLNSKGQVIGVNTAKAQAEGMGFAIPINTAAPIIEKVIRDGAFERVYMGVTAIDVSVSRENYPHVILSADRGAVIMDVNPGSPAEKAGLKATDVIISVDNIEITGSSQLVKMLLGYEAGDVIEIIYIRDGKELSVRLTLVSATEMNKIQAEENPYKNPPQEDRRNSSNGENYNNPFG